MEASREMHEFIQASDTIKGMLDGVMKECDWLDDERDVRLSATRPSAPTGTGSSRLRQGAD